MGQNENRCCFFFNFLNATLMREQSKCFTCAKGRSILEKHLLDNLAKFGIFSPVELLFLIGPLC
jgi:hypothetical protein